MEFRFIVLLRALLLGLLLLFSFSAISQQLPAPARRIVNSVKPVYPELARTVHLVGTVKIEAVVSPDGKPKFTHVLGGSPLLVQAATEALEKWRWVPQPNESKEFIEFSFHP